MSLKPFHLVCALLISFSAGAEDAPPPLPAEPAAAPLMYKAVELTVGAVSQRWAPSFSFNAFYGFGRNQRFHMGFGLRASAFLGGSGLAYTTADAVLIRDGKTQTLSLDAARTFSVNAVLHFKYEIAPRWELGMNVDLIGLGVGGPQIGTYKGTSQQVRPSGFNLLLIGNSNKGQLNAELYAAFAIAPDWWVRAGYSQMTSEVKSDATLDFGNRRFRLSSDLFFLSASYRI